MNQKLSDRTLFKILLAVAFVILIVVIFDWGRDIVPRFLAMSRAADVETNLE